MYTLSTAYAFMNTGSVLICQFAIGPPIQSTTLPSFWIRVHNLHYPNFTRPQRLCLN